jgi:hypothetical protein
VRSALIISVSMLVWTLMSTSAARAWPPDGVQAGRARVSPPGQTTAVVTASMPDGAGGIYLAWPSYDVAAGGWTIVAQRLSATGVPWPNWPSDGCPVGLPRDGAAPLLVSDGTTGIFVFWSDWDDARGTYQLAAQHIDATGSRAFPWPASGLLLGIEVHPGEACIVPDGAEGAFIAWLYRGSGALLAVRALRMNHWGSVAPGWTADGLTLSTTSHEDPPAAATDLDGFAYVAWPDHREPEVDVYLARVSMSGSVADGWPFASVPTVRAPRAGRRTGAPHAWIRSRSRATSRSSPTRAAASTSHGPTTVRAGTTSMCTRST